MCNKWSRSCNKQTNNLPLSFTRVDQTFIPMSEKEEQMEDMMAMMKSMGMGASMMNRDDMMARMGDEDEEEGGAGDDLETIGGTGFGDEGVGFDGSDSGYEF